MHPFHETTVIKRYLFSSRNVTKNVPIILILKQLDCIYLYLSISFNDKSLRQRQCFYFYFLMKKICSQYVYSTKFLIFSCFVRSCVGVYLQEYAHRSRPVFWVPIGPHLGAPSFTDLRSFQVHFVGGASCFSAVMLLKIIQNCFLYNEYRNPHIFLFNSYLLLVNI